MTENDEVRRSKLRGMLGLCKKAGRLRAGTDAVCDSVRLGEAELALIASDAAENARKRVGNCCTFYETECAEIPLGMQELASLIGRKGMTAAVGIADANFASAIKKIIAPGEETGRTSAPAPGAEHKRG